MNRDEYIINKRDASKRIPEDATELYITHVKRGFDGDVVLGTLPATRDVAIESIARATHRIATREEADAYKNAFRARTNRLIEEQEKKKSPDVERSRALLDTVAAQGEANREQTSALIDLVKSLLPLATQHAAHEGRLKTSKKED